MVVPQLPICFKLQNVQDGARPTDARAFIVICHWREIAHVVLFWAQGWPPPVYKYTLLSQVLHCTLLFTKRPTDTMPAGTKRPAPAEEDRPPKMAKAE
eukprot:3491580-Pyramimonas_sp.AAC.1